jgi:hypothetical protein
MTGGDMGCQPRLLQHQRPRVSAGGAPVSLCPRHNQMMEVGFLEVKGPVDELRYFDARGVEYKPHGRMRD